MATLVDLVGDTLVVSDIQISTGSPGTGATGYSLNTSNSVTESLSGQQKVMTSATTLTGGSATAAISIGSDGIGIYFGTGAPSALTAVTGSLYLNKGGSTASTRLYINAGATTWSPVTTAS